jgi:hypothetical protein
MPPACNLASSGDVIKIMDVKNLADPLDKPENRC